jgi:hypothetical protein
MTMFWRLPNVSLGNLIGLQALCYPNSLTTATSVSKRAGVGGFVPFESRGGLVTNEQIDRLRELDAY